MMAKMMQKMGGFFNAAIVDIRTAVDTGEADAEHTMQSLYNISTIPLVFIYRYAVKDVKQAMMLQQEAIGQIIGAYDMPQHQAMRCCSICLSFLRLFFWNQTSLRCRPYISYSHSDTDEQGTDSVCASV